MRNKSDPLLWFSIVSACCFFLGFLWLGWMINRGPGLEAVSEAEYHRRMSLRDSTLPLIMMMGVLSIITGIARHFGAESHGRFSSSRR